MEGMEGGEGGREKGTWGVHIHKRGEGGGREEIDDEACMRGYGLESLCVRMRVFGRLTGV